MIDLFKISLFGLLGWLTVSTIFFLFAVTLIPVAAIDKFGDVFPLKRSPKRLSDRRSLPFISPTSQPQVQEPAP